MITIHDNIQIEFDVQQYLDTYLPSHFDVADGSWLRGTCLFHDDSNPSMYVDTNEGGYICFSCGSRGNVVKLVQRIGRFPSYHDALDWLQSNYGVNRDETDGSFSLHFAERIDVGESDYADESVATQYLTDDIPYMTIERGIPLDVLKRFDVGYDKQSNSITIPWRDRHGRLLTVKHRAIDNKRFWYEPRCTALRHNLWGLYRCINESVVYICEAEIDAMTLWAADKPAVAIGGSHISDEQVRQLLLSGVQTVVLACDRDKAGDDANRLIRERLKHTEIDVCDAVWPRDDVKDCNDLGVDGCRLLTYKRKLFF